MKQTKHPNLVLQHRPLSRAIKLALVSACVSATLNPSNVLALTCPITTSVSVSGSETSSTYCNITASGQLDLLGSASLDNRSGATLSNFGSLVTRSGSSLSNSGVISNKASGTIRNYGILTNHFNSNTNSYYGPATLITNEGLFYNHGILNNYGRLSNNGSVHNTGSLHLLIGSSLVGSGSFTQTAGTTTIDSDMSQADINIAGGSLHNAGTLTSSQSFSNSGSLTNTGTLNQSGGFTNTGSITNQGTINSYGSFGGSGSLNNTGIFNTRGGLINGNSYYGTIDTPGDTNIANSSHFTGSTLSGGTWNIIGETIDGEVIDASLSFGNGVDLISTIATNTAVTLDGTKARFDQINQLTSNQGSLTFKNGANLSLTNDLSNSGTLTAAKSDLSSVHSIISVEAGRTLTNTGSIITESGNFNRQGVANVFGAIEGSGSINNLGRLSIYQGGSAHFGSSNNLTNGTLSGGSWRVIAGSGNASLSFGNGLTPITSTTSSTLITLSGAGAQFTQLENNLTNHRGRLEIAAGHTFNQNLILENGGSLIVQSGGVIDNHGTLNSLYSSSGIISNRAGGLFRNFGTLNSSGGYYFASSNGGTMINYGNANFTGYFFNSGSLINKGDLIISGHSRIVDSGTFSQTTGSTRVDGTMIQSTIDISGGTLGGAGLIRSNDASSHIGAAATVNPGGNIAENPAEFTEEFSIVGEVDFDGTLVIEIAGETDFDVLNVLGDIDFGSTSSINFELDTWQPGVNDSFDFLLADTVLGFDSLSYNFIGLDPGLNFNVLLTESQDLRLTFSAVPVPASAWLFGSGLLALVGFGKRKTAMAVADMKS